MDLVMLNPRITKKQDLRQNGRRMSEPYRHEEDGRAIRQPKHRTRAARSIMDFDSLTVQVIQHEIDHLEGAYKLCATVSSNRDGIFI